MNIPEDSIATKANVYVSHAWSFTFKGLLGALDDYVANNPLPNNETHYFWLDFCAVSPWELDEEKEEEGEEGHDDESTTTTTTTTKLAASKKQAGNKESDQLDEKAQMILTALVLRASNGVASKVRDVTQKARRPIEWYKTTMIEFMTYIGRTLLVLMPWDNPAPLKVRLHS